MATTLHDSFGPSADLVAAINNAAFNPGTTQKLKLFSESGISTTDALIDRYTDTLRLVPVAPRGGTADPYQSGTQDAVKVSAVHLPTRGSVYADEVQDKRGFGMADLDSPAALLKRKMTGMKQNLEATNERLRLGVIMGRMFDADGSELVDFYALFGITQISLSLDLNVTTTPILNRVIDAQRAAEDGCGGNVPTGYVALAAPDFMDSLRQNPAYDTSLRYGRPSALMADFRTGITVGDTTFIEVRTPPGQTTRIPAGEAFMVPLGIVDLLLTRYAPADYMSTVNSPGLPLYAKSEAMPLDKGYFLEAQSNPIHFCSRPGAIIRLTAAAE